MKRIVLPKFLKFFINTTFFIIVIGVTGSEINRRLFWDRLFQLGQSPAVQPDMIFKKVSIALSALL